MSDKRKELVEILDRMLTCVTALINELCPEGERERTKKCFEQACNQIRNLIVQKKSKINKQYVREKARELHSLYGSMAAYRRVITQIISEARGGDKIKKEKKNETKAKLTPKE